ncbi:MAG TPA: DUF998 domain-containing protein [Dermatophilaceae bacterium]|nr:DUF998 domain-containing protein [Dermatophilaceae bacterium]
MSTSATRPSGIPRPSSSASSAAERPLEQVPAWGVAAAITAPAILLLGYAYAVSLTPGYDKVAQAVSDLGVVGSPARWPWAFTLVFIGMAHIATALGLRPADVIGRWLLGAGGAAMIVLAFVPNNVVGKTYMRHTLTSAIVFGLLALWPAMSARNGLGVPWPLRRRVTIIVSIVVFVLIEVTLWGLILQTTTDGVREFALYAWTALWPLVVVVWTKLRPGTALPMVSPRAAS